MVEISSLSSDRVFFKDGFDRFVMEGKSKRMFLISGDKIDGEITSEDMKLKIVLESSVIPNAKLPKSLLA